MSISNNFFLIGNLTADPTSRIVGNDNKTVVNFDVAVNEKVGGKDKTTYFRITSWGAIGENAHKFLSAGSAVAVSGYMESNNRDVNGTMTYGFNFVAEEIKYLTPKKS